MSAEESNKPIAIPESLERALERLAKETAKNGWDPARVLAALDRGLRIWASLTPEQRRVVRRQIRLTRYPRVATDRKTTHT